MLKKDISNARSRKYMLLATSAAISIPIMLYWVSSYFDIQSISSDESLSSVSLSTSSLQTRSDKNAILNQRVSTSMQQTNEHASLLFNNMANSITSNAEAQANSNDLGITYEVEENVTKNILNTEDFSNTENISNPIEQLRIILRESLPNDVNIARLQLVEQLFVNDQLQDTALSVYLDDPSSTLGSILRSALAESLDSGSESILSETIGPTHNLDKRIAATELLAESQALSSATRLALSNSLEWMDDPTLREVTLRALQRRGPTEPGEAQRIVEVLQPVLLQGNELERAHSLELMSQWSDDIGTRDTILTAMVVDESDLVRASAARALSNFSDLSDQELTSLFNIAINDSEHFDIRSNAWAALEKYPMSRSVALNHRSFRRDLRLHEQENMIAAYDASFVKELSSSNCY